MHLHGGKSQCWHPAPFSLKKIMWHSYQASTYLCCQLLMWTRNSSGSLKQISHLSLHSQDAFAKGEVFVGSGENGYSVLEGLPDGTQGSFTWQYGITIVTPDRDYLFTCETEKDRQEWVAAFWHIIKQPMTPQEYASKKGFIFCKQPSDSYAW